MSSKPLLRVESLSIAFGQKRVLENLSFDLAPGQSLGVVGESGSGKSLTALSIMGLLPQKAATEGRIIFEPKGSAQTVDLLQASSAQMQSLRARRMAMVFQEPMSALNPLHTCGQQVAEVLRWHEGLTGRKARQRSIELMEEMRLPRAEKLFDSYPHELSGGQKQRVMIAMALACSPDLLIADEPTTALDVTVQKSILELLHELQEQKGMATIFITHDLGVVAQISQKTLVLYRGRVVESGTTKEIFEQAKDPYTRALIDCRPRLGHRPHRLPTVAQYIESAKDPGIISPNMGGPDVKLATQKNPPKNKDSKVLLEARDVKVWYPTAKNIFGKPTAYMHAVDGVSLDIFRGETLGLVGESGCGKSTLGRALINLRPIQAGSVSYAGSRIDGLKEVAMRPWRRKVQLIFQDPFSALNPRLTVEQCLLEPMAVHGLGKRMERSKKLDVLLDQVGLDKSARSRYPHEFSGGQRQRICIARALAVEPEFIVCDESVSALDVSVQAQVLNVLSTLKEELGLTYLFISHDLAVVNYMSDRVAVMRKGRLVELASANELYEAPQSLYTRELIASIPKF